MTKYRVVLIHASEKKKKFEYQITATFMDASFGTPLLFSSIYSYMCLYIYIYMIPFTL